MTLQDVGGALLLASSILLVFVMATGALAQYLGRRPRLVGPIFKSELERAGRVSGLLGVALLHALAIPAEFLAVLGVFYSSMWWDRAIMAGELVLAALWVRYLVRLDGPGQQHRPGSRTDGR
jgi:hypothetical protein